MSSKLAKISRMKPDKIPFRKLRTNNPQPPFPQPQTNQQEATTQPLPVNSTTTPKCTYPTSLVNTAQILSKQAQSTRFDDVFHSFFFSDKRCQQRALFMTARLKQALDSLIHPMRSSTSLNELSKLDQHRPPIVLNSSFSTPTTTSSSIQDITTTTTSFLSNDSSNKNSTKLVDGFWRIVAHRLYTLNYILFVLASDSKTRADFLNQLEANLAAVGDGKELDRLGGMEAHFAVRHALNRPRLRRKKTLLQDAFEQERKNGKSVEGAIIPHEEDQLMEHYDTIVQQARLVLEQCLGSEKNLGHAERDAMYVFHATRAGLLDTFEVHIELEEDRALRHRLKRLVNVNKKQQQGTGHENPFEDEDLIVLEEDERGLEVEEHKRQVDSGFYDGWLNNSVTAAAQV